MSSRFLIPLLCVGAVAFACGPRAHNEASAPKKNGTTVAQSVAKPVAITTQQGSARTVREAKPTVTAQLYVHAADSSIRLALHVINTGKKRVELTFPSGQTYDFVILDSLGREIWRWGSGRMFTQALRNKLLAGGEALDVEETWTTAPLPPGKYVARGTLTSLNYPLVQETEFTVTEPTVAVR